MHIRKVHEGGCHIRKQELQTGYTSSIQNTSQVCDEVNDEFCWVRQPDTFTTQCKGRDHGAAVLGRLRLMRECKQQSYFAGCLSRQDEFAWTKKKSRRRVYEPSRSYRLRSKTRDESLPTPKNAHIRSIRFLGPTIRIKHSRKLRNVYEQTKASAIGVLPNSCLKRSKKKE